jgi:hypothetical protein
VHSGNGRVAVNATIEVLARRWVDNWKHWMFRTRF